MKHYKFLSVLLIALIISACSPISPNSEGNESSNGGQAEANVETNTPVPLPTNTPAPTDVPPTNTPEPTPVLVAPFTAEVSVTSLGLRSGPSKFFPLLAYYPEGTTVVVSAQTPNNEWVYVTVADSTEEAWEANSAEIGWMMAVFLDIDEKYTNLPFMYYPDDQILVVYVFDDEGHPVVGADVAVSFNESGQNFRQDSYSDSAGVALIYFPAGYHGKIVNVEIVGLMCTAAIMNDDCKMTDYFYKHAFTFAELPYSGFVDFTFEKSTTNVVGIVVDQFGTKVADVQVRGIRIGDGAYSVTRSDEEGNFVLPIGPGEWDIFTRSYDPVLESDIYSLPSDYNSETVIITAP
jgi:hypothetical protein